MASSITRIKTSLEEGPDTVSSQFSWPVCRLPTGTNVGTGYPSVE